MEKLATTFTKRDWFHEQVKREGMVAIYQRWKIFEGEKIANHYEVVKIRERQPCIIMGKSYEEQEVYPSNEQWGTHGWTYKGYEEALGKLKKIIKKESTTE